MAISSIPNNNLNAVARMNQSSANENTNVATSNENNREALQAQRTDPSAESATIVFSPDAMRLANSQTQNVNANNRSETLQNDAQRQQVRDQLMQQMRNNPVTAFGAQANASSKMVMGLLGG